MEIKARSNSPEYTKRLANIFSKVTEFGDIIMFLGELGGGKTTFIKSLAASLGIKSDLSSPSFTLLNVYDIEDEKRFIHIDLYRFDRLSDILSTEIADIFDDDNAIKCVEWGDKIMGFLKKDYLTIEFSYLIRDGENTQNMREIIFKSKSPYWTKKMNNIKGELLA
jgi:tRNA threonylcarbamoyladenosine biosynthesis protein TsaE